MELNESLIDQFKKMRLRYTEFLGDGDTKSFGAIENTYPELKVHKFFFFFFFSRINRYFSRAA